MQSFQVCILIMVSSAAFWLGERSLRLRLWKSNLWVEALTLGHFILFKVILDIRHVLLFQLRNLNIFSASNMFEVRSAQRRRLRRLLIRPKNMTKFWLRYSNFIYLRQISSQLSGYCIVINRGKRLEDLTVSHNHSKHFFKIVFQCVNVAIFCLNLIEHIDFDMFCLVKVLVHITDSLVWLLDNICLMVSIFVELTYVFQMGLYFLLKSFNNFWLFLLFKCYFLYVLLVLRN